MQVAQYDCHIRSNSNCQLSYLLVLRIFIVSVKIKSNLLSRSYDFEVETWVQWFVVMITQPLPALRQHVHHFDLISVFIVHRRRGWLCHSKSFCRTRRTFIKGNFVLLWFFPHPLFTHFLGATKTASVGAKTPDWAYFNSITMVSTPILIFELLFHFLLFNTFQKSTWPRFHMTMLVVSTETIWKGRAPLVQLEGMFNLITKWSEQGSDGRFMTKTMNVDHMEGERSSKGR